MSFVTRNSQAAPQVSSSSYLSDLQKEKCLATVLYVPHEDLKFLVLYNTCVLYILLRKVQLPNLFARGLLLHYIRLINSNVIHYIITSSPVISSRLIDTVRVSSFVMNRKVIQLLGMSQQFFGKFRIYQELNIDNKLFMKELKFDVKLKLILYSPTLFFED